MTITISFANFLLLVLTVILAITSIYFILSLRKISKFIDKFNSLLPEAKELITKSKIVLERAESLLAESEETVKEVKKATYRVRGIVEEVTNIVEDTLFVLKPISVISQAFKTGFSLIQKFFLKEEDKEE